MGFTHFANLWSFKTTCDEDLVASTFSFYFSLAYSSNDFSALLYSRHDFGQNLDWVARLISLELWKMSQLEWFSGETWFLGQVSLCNHLHGNISTGFFIGLTTEISLNKINRELQATLVRSSGYRTRLKI